MSAFLTDLWLSIFTPGPTPTILRATNLSFAALQVVLLAMLIATRSMHFVVLSVLGGGLWWAVNWFASELAAARACQQKRDADADAKGSAETRARPKHGAHPMDESGDAEVETSVPKADKARFRGGAAAEEDELLSRSCAGTEDEWERVPGR